jgi:protein phosphatase
MQIDYFAATDRGRTRTRNEDAVLAVAQPSSGDLLLAVADGVGGLYDGAGASGLVIKHLREAAQRPEPGSLVAGVRQAVIDANELLFARSRPDPRRLSGSTVVVAVVSRDVLQVVHAGDSRAYLLRDGQLFRLTEDHSFVAEQIRAGLMTEAEAEVSPKRNLITHAVGTEPDLDPAVSEPRYLQPGDEVLLSSDGLHGVVPTPEIERILQSSTSAAGAAAALIGHANAFGGPDNIAVALARVLADSA